jgi:adenylate cyclase
MMRVDSSLTGKSQKLACLQPEQVREELHRIIGGKAINSERHKKFLAYIVEQTLAGRGDHIKAYTIATVVFDRGDDFDPSADPIVRVEAGRLRRTLDHYYLTAGKNNPLRIEIPKGGYQPEFHMTDSKQPHVIDKTIKTPTSKPASNSHNVMVLPFEYQGESPTFEYFADGLCEEIVIALSQYKNLNIIFGDISVISESDTQDTVSLCQKLNARFALTGMVRVNEDMLRVSIRLLDATANKQIMGRQYEYPNNTTNLFAVQNDITSQVALNIADVYEGAIPKILTSEIKVTDSVLTSYDAMLRVHYYNQCFSVEAYRKAREAAEQAVKNDPENALAWAALSEMLCDGYTHNFSNDNRDTAITGAVNAAKRAVSLDRSCDYAFWAMSLATMAARDTKAVISASESLLELDPSPSNRAFAGWCLALAGQWERGLEILDKNKKIMQLYLGWLHHAPFLNYYRQGHYENALNEAVKMNVPMLVWDPLERAAALSQLGRTNKARKAIDEIISLYPDFINDPRRYLNCYIMQDELVDHVIEGLIRAGLPEKTVNS